MEKTMILKMIIINNCKNNSNKNKMETLINYLA